MSASSSISRTSSHSSNPRIRRRSSVRSTTSSSSRFSELNQQREYVYALDDSSISEWLKCPICLNPFIEPILIPSCEHVFCKRCIEQHVETISRNRTTSENTDEENVEQSQYHKETRGHCPSCRARFESSQIKPAAALIRNMVDSLLVKCPNESKGCTHLAERGLIEGHVRRDCAYTYIDEAEMIESGASDQFGNSASLNGRCGCGKKVMRKDWQDHITSGDCSIERISCPFAHVENGCGSMVRASDLENHLNNCPARIQQCQYCTVELRQDEIDEHNGICEEVIIECPLAPYCQWRGRRGDLGIEANERQDATLHLATCKFAPLRSFLDSNTAAFNDLEQDNRKLTERMTIMEENQKDLVKLLSHCIAAIGSEYSPHQETSSPQVSQRNPETIVPISSPSHQSGAVVPPPMALRGRARSATGISRPNLVGTEDSESLQGQLVLAPYASAPIADNAEEEPWHWPNAWQNQNRSGEGSVFEQVSTHLNRLNLSHGINTSNSNISDSLRSINATISAISERITKVERRLDDAHVVSMNAGFEAGRAHDELNSVRHGMHSIRLQMHSLLMQQQMERSLPHQTQGPPTGPHGLYAAAAVAAQHQQQHPDASSNPTQAGNNHTFHTGQPPPPAAMMGLRRFWTGFEQTRL